ncbi:MAG: leucyl aminopeptidase [Bacilli bacterium]
MLEIIKNYKELNEYPQVFGLFQDEKINEANEYVNKLVEKKFVESKVGIITKLYDPQNEKQIFVVGLGERDNYSFEVFRKAMIGVNYKLGKELSINVKSFLSSLDEKELVKEMVLVLAYYNYVFDEFKSEKIENDLSVQLFTNIDIDKEIEEAYNIAIAIDNTRDLVNKPFNFMGPSELAEYAFDLIESLKNENVNISVLGKKEIEVMKMGAFLGVNKGSTAEPKLIHLTYKGNPSSEEKIALVGKGVMFDTGGYSLKSNMVNMKDDMAGAATVLGIFEAVVKNNIKRNIDVVICATDNRINGEALLPDDIITAMNGKTIEIVSTDAEGRLTLADAVTYAQQQGNNEIIDFATLTGAIVVALGEDTTGLFGNNQENISKLIQCGNEQGESIWHMPITDFTKEKVRGSKVADLTNSTGRGAGASGAAGFILEFINENTKWMHLDIAGTAFSTSPKNGAFYGASGATIKTVYKYLEN